MWVAEFHDAREKDPHFQPPDQQRHSGDACTVEGATRGVCVNFGVQLHWTKRERERGETDIHQVVVVTINHTHTHTHHAGVQLPVQDIRNTIWQRPNVSEW